MHALSSHNSKMAHMNCLPFHSLLILAASNTEVGCFSYITRQNLEKDAHVMKEMEARPTGLKNPQRRPVFRPRLDLSWE